MHRGAGPGWNRLAASLLEGNANPELVGKLVELLEEADEMTLARLRPYALADQLGCWPARHAGAMSTGHHARGIFELQWELLCPLCRGDTLVSPTLSGVRAQVHCDSCLIDFVVNFDHSVELTFRPNPSIRKVERRKFCIGGPQVTPHIVTQQLLPTGNTREISVSLEKGRYRVRTFALRGGQHAASPHMAPPLRPSRPAKMAGHSQEIQLAPVTTLTFANSTQAEQLFILERTAWSDQAATAAEVTALQIFTAISFHVRPYGRANASPWAV